MNRTCRKDIVKNVKKTFLRELKDGMPIKERYNIIYSKREIASPILFSISRGYFLEYGVEEYRQKCPDADTIFYRLKQAGIKHVLQSYNQTNERILSYAKKLEVFDKPLWMGMDFHNQPWHGKDDRYAVGADLRGTNWAHRIGTIEVVMPNKRFCLGCIPVYQLTSKAEVIRTLVKEARRWAAIGRLFIDRAAFNVKCLKVLEELEVPYVIPAIRNKKVEGIIREGRHLARWIPSSISYAHIVDYEMGQKEKVKTKLVVIYTPSKDPKEKDDVFAFVTSLPVNLENSLEIAESYRKRWGIETGYRVKKKLRGKTCSIYYPTRLLFQLLSIFLYNLWTLLNIITCLDMVEMPKTYPITINRFKRLIVENVKPS